MRDCNQPCGVGTSMCIGTILIPQERESGKIRGRDPSTTRCEAARSL